jgi:hypothetical protein
MSSYLQSSIDEFRRYKKLAENAIVQVDDAGFFGTPDANTNSIAIIVKHIAGNLRSRWTAFLTTDGEKPNRDRDSEFILLPADDREALLARWEASWHIAFATLAELSEEHLEQIVYVRGEPHTVIRAMQRQLAHHAYHVGQIVLLARHYAGERWTTLSIPRGGSAAVNQKLSEAAGEAPA